MYGTRFAFSVDRRVSFGLEQHGAFREAVPGTGREYTRNWDQGKITQPWFTLTGVASRNYSNLDKSIHRKGAGAVEKRIIAAG